MPAADEIGQWWTRKILNQESSAHPIFGRSVRVKVEGPVVTLSGWVEDVEEAKQLEKEALSAPSVDSVVNHLRVRAPSGPEHMQTVIGVFRDEESAKLASRTVTEATKRGEDAPDVISSSSSRKLTENLRRAKVPKARFQRFSGAVRDGNVLLLTRVPEDDVFQVVSALEGTSALSIHTLPPEPDSLEEK